MRRSVDDINRANWRDPAVVADFARSQGWLDAGEQAVLLHVADSARGLPVLDVGVGAGRTTPLLRLLSSDYLGIDYTPEMIVRARRRFPDAAFEVADARDLASLSAGSFALAYFSFNGIDAVDEAGRAAVLATMRRVLRPGGAFVYSTHSYHGPARRDRPWHIRPLSPLSVPRAAYARLERLASMPRALANYRRLRRLVQDRGERGMFVSSSNSFSLLVHFTTLASEVRALDAAGFVGIEAFGNLTGAPLKADGDHSRDTWLYFVARAPGGR